MLHLRRLELSGFKSFVDPVTIDFPAGMTAIVGPNGCGKSNLADAVLWVLGEQSAKTLRGDTMEDVIFDGSESRKPLGMAEVSVTFLADPSHPAADNGMLTLSRRVFRSGESQYRLNGRRVRLKEIKDLLMDTGLGIRAYSVIEQGKIGLILSGKPQERRKLLEEAAGMTRYKARRRVAEVKLEEAAGNLQRLDDVISEVERSLRSLKRQAGAARRYKEREGEVRILLRQVLSLRWSALRERLANLDRSLQRTQGREAELIASLHRGEADLAAGREALEEAGARLAEEHRLQAQLAARIEGRQAFLRGARHSLEEAAERLRKGRLEKERRQEELDEHARSLGDLGRRRTELEQERDRAASAVAADATGLQAAEGRFREAERRLEEVRSQLLVSLNEATGSRNLVHREQIELERTSYRLARLEEDIAAHRDEARQAEEEAKEGSRTTGLLTERVEELETRRRERLEARQRLADERRDLGERQAELSEELGRLENRRVLLGDLAEAQAERRDRIGRLLAEAGTTGARFFGDLLAAPAGWEESLDLFLGELADAVLLPEDADLEPLVEALESSGAGAVFLVPAAAAPAHPGVTDPAIEAPLGEALGLPPELARALPPAYLVSDPQAARRLARQHPGVAFLSRRLWAQSGMVHIRSQPAGPGALARAGELRELAIAVPALEAKLEAAGRIAAELDHRQDNADHELQELGAVSEEEGRRLAVARARLEDQEARARRLHVELETMETEKETLEGEARQLRGRIAEAESALAEADTRHRELEAAFDVAQKRLEEDREAREALRTGQAGRRGRLDVIVERLESLQTEARRLEERRAEASRWLESWEVEDAELEERRQAFEAEIGSAEAELQAALERSGSRESELAGAQQELEEKRQCIRALEQRISGLRADRETTQQEIGEQRVERASVQQETEHVATSFREEFGAEPEPPGEDLGSDDLPRLEEELAAGRATLERLGPVNVLAAEEFAEQQQRHEFLASQRQDVAGSVERLKATIREINQASTERFERTFKEVNEHFGRTFIELFGGGEAEMRLMDEEDVLESGIEIVARPPGKRLQNMMLLSGGEKALTAIALLFALFRTKPSPFCILDEVDAPLDDPNTLRFHGLLRSLSQEVQFLLITHNKLTMEVVSTLYGVTMEEKGVSKLVSVRLEDFEDADRAASSA